MAPYIRLVEGASSDRPASDSCQGTVFRPSADYCESLKKGSGLAAAASASRQYGLASVEEPPVEHDVAHEGWHLQQPPGGRSAEAGR